MTVARIELESRPTGGGLGRNLELNLGQYQPVVAGQVERWFEDLWAEAVPYDLASIYEARYAEYTRLVSIFPHLLPGAPRRAGRSPGIDSRTDCRLDRVRHEGG